MQERYGGTGTQTLERGTTRGNVNFASAIPDPIHAQLVGTKEPVRLIALGDIEGQSPCYLAVDLQGRSKWFSLDDVKIVDPDFSPAQSMAGTGRS